MDDLIVRINFSKSPGMLLRDKIEASSHEWMNGTVTIISQVHRKIISDEKKETAWLRVYLYALLLDLVNNGKT